MRPWPTVASRRPPGENATDTTPPVRAFMLRTVAAGVAKPEDLEADGPGAGPWWSVADLEAGPGP